MAGGLGANLVSTAPDGLVPANNGLGADNCRERDAPPFERVRRRATGLSQWWVSGAALAVVVLGGGSARAQTDVAEGASATPAETTPAEPDAEKTARARRHFKNGIKLYGDADYRGALAEFEAAYREKPGPSSLQNAALSLKGLFRYAEAADALRLLLARHAAELSEDERSAVRNALDELASLVGTLTISVDPPEARVSVDGRPLTAEERTRGVPLNVGEHTLTATAPGYARKVQLVRIASQQRLPIAVKLEPTAGFLEIVSTDPNAAIALNGEPLAFHRWSGPVAPDVDHTIQIYRRGFEPFETTARLELGQKVRVSGALGAPTGEAIDAGAAADKKPGAPPELRVQKGLYLLFALGVAGANDAPLGLEVAESDLTFGSIGGRAGYRLTQTLAVEGALDIGRVDADGACDWRDRVYCIERNFSLSVVRAGTNLRLYTGGETIRFPIAIGAGIVNHTLKLDPVESADLSGGKASGVDPYFSIEFGASYNYRHLLVELGIAAFIESASELRGSFDDGPRTSAFESGTLPLLGLSVKVGYSAWTPKR